MRIPPRKASTINLHDPARMTAITAAAHNIRIIAAVTNAPIESQSWSPVPVAILFSRKIENGSSIPAAPVMTDNIATLSVLYCSAT